LGITIDNPKIGDDIIDIVIALSREEEPTRPLNEILAEINEE